MKYFICVLFVFLVGCPAAHTPYKQPRNFSSFDTLDNALERAFPKQPRYPNPNDITDSPFL